MKIININFIFFSKFFATSYILDFNIKFGFIEVSKVKDCTYVLTRSEKNIVKLSDIKISNSWFSCF